MNEGSHALGFCSPMAGLSFPDTHQSQFVLLSRSDFPNPPERSDLLHTDEIDLLNSMRSDKRRREFALGRIAARQAFDRLDQNLTVPALGRQPTGAVEWPPGFCGSITHCGQYAAAVVAACSTFSSIGIDLQQIAAFEGSEVALRIADTRERAWIERSSNELESLAVVFSAKESIYKALTAFVGPGLGFRDVRCQPLALGEIDSTQRLSGVLQFEVVNSIVSERIREKCPSRLAANGRAEQETSTLELSVSVQIARGYVLSGIAL